MEQLEPALFQFFEVGFMLCGHWSWDPGCSKDTTQELALGSYHVYNFVYY